MTLNRISVLKNEWMYWKCSVDVKQIDVSLSVTPLAHLWTVGENIQETPHRTDCQWNPECSHTFFQTKKPQQAFVAILPPLQTLDICVCYINRKKCLMKLKWMVKTDLAAQHKHQLWTNLNLKLGIYLNIKYQIPSKSKQHISYMLHQARLACLPLTSFHLNYTSLQTTSTFYIKYN